MGSEPNFIKSPTPSPPSIWDYIIRFPLWIKNTVAKVINRITLLSLFILIFISLYEHNFDFSSFHSIFIETMKEVGIALFIVGSGSYRLTAFGIGFMDEQKLSIAPFEDANAIKVEFSDWILPGDGSVFNIIKNGV